MNGDEPYQPFAETLLVLERLRIDPSRGPASSGVVVEVQDRVQDNLRYAVKQRKLEFEGRPLWKKMPSGAVVTVQSPIQDGVSATRRKPAFGSGPSWKRATDLFGKEDPSYEDVDDRDERTAFFEGILPEIATLHPTLFIAALVIIARVYIEADWPDANLVQQYREYSAIRARVALLGSDASERAMGRAGFRNIRGARKYLGAKWKEYTRDTA
jgi:hypothetical protein